MHKTIAKKARFYSNIIQQLVQKKELLQKADAFSIHLILPALLSSAAVFFEGISLGLLIPIIKGIIEMDFGFARELPVFKDIIARFPQLFPTPNSSIFIFFLVTIFTATVMKNVLTYLSVLSIDYQFRRFTTNLRKLVMERFLSFGKLFFDRTSSGHLFNNVTSFAELSASRIRHIHVIIKWLLAALIYFTIMFAISWKLTIFMLIITPIFYYSLSWLVEKIKKTSIYFADSKRMLSARVYNVLSCMPLIKLYTTEKREKEMFGYASDQVSEFEFSMDKKERLLEPLQETVILTIILLLISFMAYFVIREKSAEVSGFLVYFYVLRRASGAFSVISKERGNLARTTGPLDEILKIFDDEEKYFVPEGKKEFAGLKGSIDFKGLNYSYMPEVKTLKDITFSVKEGEMTAIVGPTGAGKTTLVHLLLRFYDCPPSSIMMDGVDIREFTLKSLRADIALVSQETLLFNDTLRANIIYGFSTIDDNMLIDVVKKARLYDFILKLPDGFNTFIGDRGVKLSGGEKQRVAIARALLKGPEILILDEATSSLDSVTERLIQEAIEEAVKDRTSIVIAHRLSTIKNADKVVVIEDGRLMEQGSLSALLEKKGKFYEYWNEQRFF